MSALRMKRERPTSVEVQTIHDDGFGELRIRWEVRYDDHVSRPYNWAARFLSACRVERFSDEPGDIETAEVSEEEAEKLVNFDDAMVEAAELAEAQRA